MIALMCFAACDNPVEKNTHLGNSDFVMVESTDNFYVVYQNILAHITYNKRPKL